MQEPRFSILIPLEFTRGIAERCVETWTAGIDYPRDRYGLLIAAPEDYDPAEIGLLRSMLGPRDEIISVPEEHDIALVAEAARRTDGEILVFTEAHCIPEPDFLRACDRAFDENPGWRAFSGGSRPLVHNLLSRVEADMYAADIEANMRKHPWLKVLDQCFVIERRAYEECGGLEPRFGHFAEHLLAARLYRAGIEVGYDPRAEIGHHYVGEIDELVEFARDYGHGQLLFAAQAAEDPCGDLFTPPAVWRDRLAAEPSIAELMLNLLADAARPRLGVPKLRRRRTVRRRPLWVRGVARWKWAATATPERRMELRERAVRLGSLRLRAWIALRNRKRAARAFRALNDAAAELGGAQALETLRDSEQADDAELNGNPNLSGWTAVTADLVPSVGFHDLERVDRRPFRWSEPVAVVSAARLNPGARISLSWAGIDGQGHEHARFYLNERRVPAQRIEHGRHWTVIEVDRALEPARLAWVTGPAKGDGDPRALGLPVSEISWGEEAVSSPEQRLPDLSRMRRPTSAAVAGADPIYLLHVQKCAGTSLRATIGNGFGADERLARTHAFYYARQLEMHRDRVEAPFALAIGHFGWDLPAALGERDLRVMTVLREPLDHFRSLHAYLVQQEFLPASSDFTAWLRDELRLRDTLIGHLVPGCLDRTDHGLDTITGLVGAAQAQAAEHLRSCETVGVFERMDESLNLLCAATGVLPPLRIPHLNRTLARSGGSGTSAAPDDPVPEAQGLLAIESRLHALATAICDRQIARLRAELGAGNADDADDVRMLLRRRWFDRHGADLAAAEPDRAWAWLPGDPLPGENMHPLEEHGGLDLRWTGPDEETLLHAPIDTGRRWRMRIALHPASPGDHIDALVVAVNDRAVDIARVPAGDLASLNGGGPVLEGTLEAPEPGPATSPFSVVALRSPVRRGAGEFRHLGLALAGLLLEPLA